MVGSLVYVAFQVRQNTRALRGEPSEGAPMPEPDPVTAFAVQPDVRGPWRRYLDSLAPLRPGLHRLPARRQHGEDLVQDTLLRLSGLLGRTGRRAA